MRDNNNNNNKIEGRRHETNWMPIEINLISGSLKNLFPSLLFHCTTTIRMECQKTYKKLKDSVFYFFFSPLYALSASSNKIKVLKKWWWSVFIWWFAKNCNIHLRSFVVYVCIFLSNCNKRKRKTREEGYTIDAQYFVTNLHKITCMLQLLFLPVCLLNVHIIICIEADGFKFM